MTKKRKGEKPRREFTKRHLALWEQQKRRQRIILGAGIFTIVAVLVIVAAGWYISQFQPLHVTAIRVNDAKFNMGYYIEMLKVQGQGQSASNMEYFAELSVKITEQNALIEQGALALGITVSDDAIRQKLKSSGLPNDSVHRDIIRTQLLATKLKSDYFEKQVLATASQAHVMAMLLESESQAAEVRARLGKGEGFADLAGQLSLNSLTKQDKGDIGWHPEDVFADLLGSKIPGEYAFGAEAGVLSQPRYDADVFKGVGYWLIKVLEREADTKEAHVEAMLLGSEQQAQAMKTRLEAGEDFATLAKESSQVTNVQDNGGDLGLISQGNTTTAFDKFAFDTGIKLGTLSEPIRDDAVTTKGGYWLIQVLDKADDRPIDSADRDSLKEKALQDWAASLWAGPNEIDDSYLDTSKRAWAITQALKG